MPKIPVKPRRKRPFWVPASSYYVLSVALAAAFFFVVWGILLDSGEPTPWVTAGIAASVFICGAVVIREMVFRRARARFLRDQELREIRDQTSSIRARTSDNKPAKKLSIEANAVILKQIAQKAEAANLLNKFSAGHREVFEMCAEYLALNENELKSVNPNSPRLAPLLRGRSTAADYHRFHMLKWAEIEARGLTADAQEKAAAVDRVEAATKAVTVVETALTSYPQERSLIESRALLREMVVSIKVSDWVERAEKAAFKGDRREAIDLYKDALFYLARDPEINDAREQAAEHIYAEIQRLENLEAEPRH
jgi:hypothetical protein